MRLNKYIIPTLVTLLVLSAGGLYFLNLSRPQSRETKSVIVSKLNQKNRFQGLLLDHHKNKLSLVYLLSYEPFSNNFSAIYFNPNNRIFSSTFAEEKSLAKLYSALDRARFISELSEYLNLNLSFWIESKSKDLRYLVDCLGGLTVQNSKPTEQSDSSAHGRWMDGSMAINFAGNAYEKLGKKGLRLRHKALFLALIRRLNQTTFMVKSIKTFQNLEKQLKTNLTRKDLRALANLLPELKPEKIKFLAAFPNKIAVRKKIKVARVQRMVPRPIKKIIEESEPQKVIKIQLLNGAGIAGLAGIIRNKLQKLSFIDVVEVGNADRFDYKTSVIIDHSNNPQSAYRIRKLLKTGKLEFNPSKQLMVDVTLIIGKDLKTFAQQNISSFDTGVHNKLLNSE